MTLFDPYSHTRIQELRQEQLARNARRREQLKFESAIAIKQFPIAEIVRRITLRSAPAPKPQAARPAGRQALDS